MCSPSPSRRGRRSGPSTWTMRGSRVMVVVAWAPMLQMEVCSARHTTCVRCNAAVHISDSVCSVDKCFFMGLRVGVLLDD